MGFVGIGLVHVTQWLIGLPPFLFRPAGLLFARRGVQ
jgi:hypothetical protein